MSDGPREVWHGITRMVRGGAQLVVLDLLAGLDRSRFTPVLVAGEETGSEGSLWPEADALGIEIIRVPSLVRRPSPWHDCRALFALTKLLRARRPAIVHSHTSKAGFLLSRAARRARIESIVFAPHGHIVGLDAAIPGVPRRGWKRALLKKLAIQSSRDAHVVVCPNESERRDGIELGMWEEDSSLVVPNGIDPGKFIPGDRASVRAQWDLPLDAPIVGVIARHTREKGVDVAIEAVAQLPDTHLVLIGDGPEQSALRSLAAQHAITERVHFFGLRDDVPALIPAFDVVAVPSRTEAHGLVAAEALSCEVPVVASAVGGLRSVVVEEKVGTLVRPDDAAALANALRRVLTDRPWAERLGRQGRRLIIDEWSLEAMLRGTEELYDRLSGEPSREEPSPSISVPS